MRTRSKLVWKLNAVVVAILTAAIALSGYLNNWICAHYSLESARTSLRFNSESIIQGIGQLMMNRNNEGIEELITEFSRNSSVYGDIRLISHHSGDVEVSRFGSDVAPLELADRACAVCHDQPTLDDTGLEIKDNPTDLEIKDMVVESPQGERMLSVVAPILNEQGCRTAACHAHAESPEILGFLTADYSLGHVDSQATDRRVLIVVTMIASLLLAVIALSLFFQRLLGRPIDALIAGTKQIAANQLDFRFPQKRNDEIGLLEESFNTMTARVQAHRRELREAMEYLGGMVENSTDIIITGTTEGFIETFNQGAEQALGYSRVEVIGRRIETLYVVPEDRHVVSARLEDTGNVQNYESRLRTKNGGICHILLTLSYLRDRKGNPIGTIGISKNITHEKELQRELVQSQKFAAIGEAVTGIQHAIKNMLNTLKGGSYLVQVGMAKDEHDRIREGLAMVEEGIERIRGLAGNLLNYAKEWKLDPHGTDLNAMAAKVCEQNYQAALDRGVTLRFNTPEPLPEVLCDPRLIHMAATDIVINAVDACTWKDYPPDEQPEIVLENSVSADQNTFEIEIRDNGCGMTEETKRDIFTPFFSTKKTRGTGLGLALTARIINVHGGEILVESEPDHGTAFRIRLPVEGPHPT